MARCGGVASHIFPLLRLQGQLTLPNCMATARAAREGVGRLAPGAGSAAADSAAASAASVHTCTAHENGCFD